VFPHQTARILGLVTPLGNTVQATWPGLMAGRSGAGPIAEFDVGGFLVRFACEVKDFDPLNYVEKKEARKMGAFTHYAIAASDEALADSGLKITPESAERVGSYSNSGLGARKSTGHRSSQLKSIFRHLPISRHVFFVTTHPEQSVKSELS
jgi:3-oxoacyl-(acyl-carrier-protein) synthase